MKVLLKNIYELFVWLLKYISTFKAILFPYIFTFLTFTVFSFYFNPNKDYIEVYAKNQMLNNLQMLEYKTQEEEKWKTYLENFKSDTYTHRYWDMYKKEEEIKDWIIKSIFIEIPKLWIYEPLYIMKIWDMEEATEFKPDSNMVDIEMKNLYDINDGFLIWAHSSWYSWDISEKKDIFKDLYTLSQWDKVTLHIETSYTSIKKEYKIYKMDTWRDMKVSTSEKILYTCHPPWTSEMRLVVRLEEIK